MKCPTCDSLQPSMHPAVSGGGEVTNLCPDDFHTGDPVTEKARRELTSMMKVDVQKTKVIVRIELSESDLSMLMSERLRHLDLANCPNTQELLNEIADQVMGDG